MIKTIITAAALTAISFSAHAKYDSVTQHDINLAIESGNSHVCNTLDGKHGSFNPTNLTDFAKCWIDVHKSDKLGGVDFGQAWAKINGTYYSVPLSVLKQAGSAAAAKEMFRDSIVAEISDVQAAAIQSAAAEAITDTQSQIETIKEITKVVEVLVEVEVPVEVIVERVKTIYVDRIETIEVPVEVIVERVITNTVDNLTQALINGNAHATAINALDGLDAINDYIADNLGYNTVGIMNLTDKATATTDVVNNFTEVSTGNNWDVSTSLNVRLGGIASGQVPLNAIDVVIGQIQSDIESAISAAYDSGFADGYEAGYKDGFTDGVNSVR